MGPSSKLAPALWRFARFVVVGALNTALSYAVFALLIWLGLHFTLATLASSVVGVLVGFQLHGAFVFDHPGDGKFWRFMLISILVLGCNVISQALLHPYVNDYVAGALAACITIPVSFGLNRAFVFRAAAAPGREHIAEKPSETP
jgi:putative flippase GtrA